MGVGIEVDFTDREERRYKAEQDRENWLAAAIDESFAHPAAGHPVGEESITAWNALAQRITDSNPSVAIATEQGITFETRPHSAVGEKQLYVHYSLYPTGPARLVLSRHLTSAALEMVDASAENGKRNAANRLLVEATGITKKSLQVSSVHTVADALAQSPHTPRAKFYGGFLDESDIARILLRRTFGLEPERQLSTQESLFGWKADILPSQKRLLVENAVAVGVDTIRLLPASSPKTLKIGNPKYGVLLDPFEHDPDIAYGAQDILQTRTISRWERAYFSYVPGKYETYPSVRLQKALGSLGSDLPWIVPDLKVGIDFSHPASQVVQKVVRKLAIPFLEQVAEQDNKKAVEILKLLNSTSPKDAMS